MTNADKFKHYERWATASEFPVRNIINDGTTSWGSRLGAVSDLSLCLRVKKIQGQDVMVIAGDVMFQASHFAFYYFDSIRKFMTISGPKI